MRLQGLVIGAALSVMAFGAQAAPVTFQFTASVTKVTNDIGLLGALSAGDILTGIFSVDPSDTPSSTFGDSSTYSSPNASLSATVSGITISRKIDQISVTNDSPTVYDRLDLSGGGNDDSGTGLGYGSSSLSVLFQNQTNPDMLTSQSIPSDFSFSDFDDKRNLALFYFTGYRTPGDFTAWDGINADITSLERVAPVPLPAGLPLLAAGVGLFGLVGWRRQRVSGS